MGEIKGVEPGRLFSGAFWWFDRCKIMRKLIFWKGNINSCQLYLTIQIASKPIIGRGISCWVFGDNLAQKTDSIYRAVGLSWTGSWRTKGYWLKVYCSCNKWSSNPRINHLSNWKRQLLNAIFLYHTTQAYRRCLWESWPQEWQIYFRITLNNYIKSFSLALGWPIGQSGFILYDLRFETFYLSLQLLDWLKKFRVLK
jgi:hypothetical protein